MHCLALNIYKLRVRKNQKIGEVGEKVALLYLIRKEFRIISTNQRVGRYEIDIVAQSPNGVVTFIEVKTRATFERLDSSRKLMPEDNLTRQKLRNVKNSAIMFANYFLPVNNTQGWQADLLSIVLVKDSLTNEIKSVLLRHYENILSQ